MTTAPECRICDLNARLEQGALPLRERIAHDAHWRVACASVALPGWLVLMPRRHVTAIADLTDDEAMPSAPGRCACHARCTRYWLPEDLRRAFAEAEGFSHVHFHIVPRADSLPPSLHGPGIFELLKPEAPPADPGHIDHVASTLHELLRR